jgi:hypothetical protein
LLVHVGHRERETFAAQSLAGREEVPRGTALMTMHAEGETAGGHGNDPGQGQQDPKDHRDHLDKTHRH